MMENEKEKSQKCECPSCNCSVDSEHPVEKDGKHYCSETCCTQCSASKCVCEDCCSKSDSEAQNKS